MGFQTGLTGLNVFSKTLDVIGNNIANSNTVGMKASRTEYADLASVQPGSRGGSGIGFGVSIATTAQQFTQGNFSVTGNSLDLAINGNGFFQVINPNGTKAYTRDGQFKVDKEGNLMTNSGANVMGYKTDKTGTLESPALPTKIQVPSGAPIAASETKNIIAGLNLTNRAQGATATTPFTPVATYGTAVTAFDAQGTENPVSLYFSRGPSIPENSVTGTEAKDVWYVYDAITQKEGDTEIKGTATTTATATTAVKSAEAAVAFAKTPGAASAAATAATATKTAADAAKLSATAAGATGTLVIDIDAAVTAATTAQTDLAAAIAAAAAAAADPSNTVLAGTAASTKLTAATSITAAKTLTQTAKDSAALAAGGSTTFAVVAADASTTYTTAIAAEIAFNKMDVSAKEAALVTAKTNLATASDSDSKRTKALFKMEFTQDGKLSASYTNGKDATAGTYTATDAAGQLKYAIDPTKVNPSSIVKPFDVAIDLSATTQFSDAFAVNKLTQDGYTSGSLTGLNVDNTGKIITNYSNGQTQVQGILVLADFRNTQGLTSVGSGNYIETLLSGTPVLGTPGVGKFGDMRAGALEDSNVDLTAELVNMMTAQRNYQANAQTIKTQDQVLSTLVNLR